MNQIHEDKPPYFPYGRYVCDWNCREAHLFNTVTAAREFAKNWNRDCNIGWLSPVYNAKTGANSYPSAFEAGKQIARNVNVVDHR